jgi:hypothetical protein
MLISPSETIAIATSHTTCLPWKTPVPVTIAATQTTPAVTVATVYGVFRRLDRRSIMWPLPSR